jgi:uncharacterized cupredoxin-like copper-binding protein
VSHKRIAATKDKRRRRNFMGKIRYLGVALVAAVGALLWSLPASGQEGSARGTVVTVLAGKPTEFSFNLSTKTIKSGAVTFKVTNNGALPHDFKVCASPTAAATANACTGKATKQLTPGSSATLVVIFAKSGSYEFLCTVSGHAAAGMKGKLTVALAGAAATPTRYTAKLNASQERPRPQATPAAASGTFTATLSGKTLKWKLTFAHLTGAARAAHIHLGATRTSGAVLVPLCGPCKAQTSGTRKITTSTIRAMAAGKTYVNVHTKKNPKGEIRGQIRR